MDEILELQQQLAAVQQGSSSQKLSERNCVELVMKLQALNLVDLIFTKSGKEYLTHKQLVIEIEDELLARGGRVNVIDLPEALNVDLAHIQSKLPEIVAASNDSTQLVRGALLTDYYLASIAEEINDALTSSEHGTDNIGGIASRYSLPVDVVRELVSTHLGTLINASIDAQNPDLLRSASSIARDRAAARGLLRAVTAPTALSDLSRLRGLPLSLVATLVEEMLEEGSLSGSRVGRGARAIFVPAVFTKAAVNAATSAFVSNGFVTIERLSKMHIEDIRGFVSEHLRGSLVLNSCIVGPTLVDTLSTSASEAVSAASWLDMDVSLPPDFPQDDVAAIMTRVVDAVLMDIPAQVDPPEGKTSTIKSARTRRKTKASSGAQRNAADSPSTSLVVGDRYIVSPSIVKSLCGRFESDALQKARERARLMAEKTATIVTQTGSDAPSESPDAPVSEAGRKSKGKGRRRAASKEKSKNSAANGSGTNANGMDSEFPVCKPSMDEAVEMILMQESWSGIVETDFLGSSNAGEEMIAGLVEQTYGEDGLGALYQAKAEEAVADLVRERALAKKNAEKALLAGLEEAELYNKSASSFSDQELIEASRTWVIDEICVNVLCRVVDSVAQSTGIMDASAARAHERESKKEKLEVIRSVLPKLAPVLEAKIRALLMPLSDKSGGTVDGFLSLYDESTAILDLPERRPLDKKGEKAAFASARAQLTLSLDSDNGLTEAKCLRTAAVLAHAKTCGGSIVQIPLTSVAGFCKTIEENARPAEVGQALRELRESLTSTSNADSVDASSSTMSVGAAEKLSALREYIG